MVRKKARTAEQVESDLAAVRAKRDEASHTLDYFNSKRNVLWVEGKALGMTIAGMARVSGANEQHVRNVVNGRNTYAAKHQSRRD